MSDLQNLKSTAGQPSSVQPMGAAEVLEQALEGFRTGNLQPLTDLMAEDAVWEFPYAPPDRRRIEGKSNIVKFFQAFLSSAAVIDFKDIEIHRMVDPDCVVAELTGCRTVRTTGTVFEGRYVEVCHTKNGFIKLYREYWNPQSSPAHVSRDNGANKVD